MPRLLPDGPPARSWKRSGERSRMKPSKKVALLDTNVILRFVLGDDAAQSARAHAVMKRLESAQELAELEDIVLAETVWVLEKHARVPRFEIVRTLSDLLAFPG